MLLSRWPYLLLARLSIKKKKKMMGKLNPYDSEQIVHNADAHSKKHSPVPSHACVQQLKPAVCSLPCFIRKQSTPTIFGNIKTRIGGQLEVKRKQECYNCKVELGKQVLPLA